MVTFSPLRIQPQQDLVSREEAPLPMRNLARSQCCSCSAESSGDFPVLSGMFQSSVRPFSRIA